MANCGEVPYTLDKCTYSTGAAKRIYIRNTDPHDMSRLIGVGKHRKDSKKRWELTEKEKIQIHKALNIDPNNLKTKICL